VPGILADVNVLGHVQVLLQLMQGGYRAEIWAWLNYQIASLADLGLASDASDRIIWQKCQDQRFILITANRNEKDPDSLGVAIREQNRLDSLPVITLANSERILKDRAYAEVVADRLLEYLFEIDKHLGTGRVFVP
jgi:hypothetical protein